jgi:hypothetical protein
VLAAAFCHICRMPSARALAAIAVAVTLALAAPARAGQADSDAGLRAIVEELLAAGKAGDATRVEAICRQMVLPDHEAWFRRVFGAELAPKLAAEYKRLIDQLEKEFDGLLAQVIKENRTTVRVRSFRRADDADANGHQKRALRAMKSKLTLYSARLARAEDKVGGIHFYSFVHVGGSFRFLGKMKALGE